MTAGKVASAFVSGVSLKFPEKGSDQTPEMDRPSLIKKLIGALTGKAGMAMGFVAVGALALTAGMHLGKTPVEPSAPHGKSHEAEEGHAEHVAMTPNPSAHEEHGAKARPDENPAFYNQLLGRYIEAWHSVQEKVDAVRTAELENERLKLENTHLRLSLEGLQFNCSAKEASTKTRAFEYKLDKETGSLVGRDLASIAYRVPTNLVPGQLYTLGISYFKAREDEKAAVIFTFLTGLDDSEIFKTPKNFLLTGIAWYRLDNFATAERYFDRALKAQEKPENLQTLAHARLWKALTASRTDKHTQSQFWLTELIDHSPLSLEASWVNSKMGGRGPRTPASKASEAHDGAGTEE
jgi:hypothetical protein